MQACYIFWHIPFKKKRFLNIFWLICEYYMWQCVYFRSKLPFTRWKGVLVRIVSEQKLPELRDGSKRPQLNNFTSEIEGKSNTEFIQTNYKNLLVAFLDKGRGVRELLNFWGRGEPFFNFSYKIKITLLAILVFM